MIYKETIEMYVSKDDDIQNIIQEKHKNGWVLLSHIFMIHHAFGDCSQLVFERWNESFDNKIIPTEENNEKDL